MMREAPKPATADDVSILADGRRLATRENVLEWLAENPSFVEVDARP